MPKKAAASCKSSVLPTGANRQREAADSLPAGQALHLAASSDSVQFDNTGAGHFRWYWQAHQG